METEKSLFTIKIVQIKSFKKRAEIEKYTLIFCSHLKCLLYMLSYRQVFI